VIRQLVMKPAAMLVNYIHTTKKITTQYFGRLGIPLNASLARAVSESDHNNGCDPLPKKVWTPVIQADLGRHLTVCTTPAYAILNSFIFQTIALVFIPS